MEMNRSGEINAFFDQQLSAWDDARQRFANLEQVSTREIVVDGFALTIQYNPTRIVSTSANISKQALSERPCFLCEKNRPACQMTKVVDDDFELLVNPFPIMPKHYTIPLRRHEPQVIADRYEEMLKLLLIEDETFKDEGKWMHICRRVQRHLGKNYHAPSARMMARWRRVHQDLCNTNLLKQRPRRRFRRSLRRCRVLRRRHGGSPGRALRSGAGLSV